MADIVLQRDPASLSLGGNVAPMAAITAGGDGTTWSNYTPPYPNSTYTQPGVIATGAGTVRGISGQEVYLGSAMRYVRFDYTPTLSNTSTDTATLMVHAHYSGFSHLPPP